MKKLQTWVTLRGLVHLGAWLPLAWLAWAWWSDAVFFTANLTVNPIQAATKFTGKTAIILLTLSLACTPLNTVFGFRQALSVRRALGLYAFLYAALHFTIFAGVDFGFNWTFLQPEITDKPYIIVGLTAGLILLALAATSFRWWMKRLGRNWTRLHRLVYLAGLLVVLHYAWALKGDLFRLQGDVLQPLLFAGLVGLLLALRLPPLRRWASGLRARWRVRSPQGAGNRL